MNNNKKFKKNDSFNAFSNKLYLKRLVTEIKNINSVYTKKSLKKNIMLNFNSNLFELIDEKYRALFYELETELINGDYTTTEIGSYAYCAIGIAKLTT